MNQAVRKIKKKLKNKNSSSSKRKRYNSKPSCPPRNPSNEYKRTAELLKNGDRIEGREILERLIATEPDVEVVVISSHKVQLLVEW